MRRTSRLLLAALAVAPACSSASGPASRGSIVVDAASSLSGAFRMLGQRFDAAHPGWHVTFNFAGSDSLAAQLAQGAPADVFAAASPRTMATARHAAVTAGPPTLFAANRVELAVPVTKPAHNASLADTTRPGVKVALCAPTVPCGIAARAAYAAAHVTPHPATDELNVTAVLTKVELGEVDAGIVYQTDVRSTRRVHGIPLGRAAAATAYPIAAIRTGHHVALGRAFVQLVLSAQGRRVLRDAGFLDVRVAG